MMHLYFTPLTGSRVSRTTPSLKRYLVGFSCNQTQGLPSVFTLQNELCVSLRPDKRADCFSISNPALFTSLQYPSSYCSITPLSTLPSAIVNQRNSLVSMLAQNGHPLVETLIRSSTSGQELHSAPRFTLRTRYGRTKTQTFLHNWLYETITNIL